MWRDQSISDAVAAALREISHAVHQVITDPPAGTSHVGEWTKKEACWARVQALEWSVPPPLQKELLDVSKAQAIAKSAARASLTAEDEELIARASRVPAEEWLALSHWARETGNLEAWQRQLAYSMGRLKNRGTTPSIKQARQGVKALDAARALGFRPADR